MARRTPLSEQEQGDLVAFLDGELAGAPTRRIEARLSLDPSVRAEANALKRVWDLLDMLPRAEPSPLFTSRTVERLTAGQVGNLTYGSAPSRPWALGLGWVAALFLATWVGFAGFSRVAPREATDTELVRDLRVIENKRLYDLIDDLDFLHELDHPELFGDEIRGS